MVNGSNPPVASSSIFSADDASDRIVWIRANRRPRARAHSCCRRAPGCDRRYWTASRVNHPLKEGSFGRAPHPSVDSGHHHDTTTMSSQQPIPGSYKKPPFSSSPYGVTPPPIPNIPLRTTGSPANDNTRGSIAEGGGSSYVAAATSFRPKSFKPRAASGGTGSFFSAHSQTSAGFLDNGNGNGIGEKKPINRTSNEAAGSVGGVSALSKALEREGVAKASQDGDTPDDKGKRLTLPERSDSNLSVPRVPTPKDDTRSDSASQNPTPAVTATPTDISEIPEEEKLRILRKHLVSAEERQQASPTPGDGVSPGGSRTASIHGGSGYNVPAPQAGPAGSAFSRVSGTRTPDAGGSGVTQPPWDGSADGDGNGEAFPIPYDAPGGDVT